MTDQELLQAIRSITKEEVSQLMDQKLQPITQRLDSIEQRMDDLEESLEETRTGVNMLIAWSEKVSMAAKFPLPDIDDEE